MKTLQDFKLLIINQAYLLGISEKQFEIFTENGKLKQGSNKEDENGLHYIDFEYSLTIQIEEMKSESLGLLSLLTLQFVNGLNNEDDSLNEIDFDFEANDLEKSIDVEISFDVRDPVYLVPVDAGYTSPIMIDGKAWGFGDGSLSVAESLAGINVNN